MTELIDTLTPDTREKVLELLALAQERYGYKLRIVSARRSCQEQAKLYAQGRTAPGNVVTNAKGCMSWHTLGRAVDLGFIQPNPSPQDWENLGELGESLGFIWGKRFGPKLNDLPHFEYHPGVKIEQICTNPDDCEAGVAASMGVTFGSGSSGSSESVFPYVAIVISSAVIAWALLD